MSATKITVPCVADSVGGLRRSCPGTPDRASGPCGTPAPPVLSPWVLTYKPILHHFPLKLVLFPLPFPTISTSCPLRGCYEAFCCPFVPGQQALDTLLKANHSACAGPSVHTLLHTKTPPADSLVKPCPHPKPNGLLSLLIIPVTQLLFYGPWQKS